MFERIQHLSSAMAAGDSRAVDAFYRQYFDWMYAQARRVTRRDESFCLDVVQDAVLRVMRTVRAVDCESRFRSWLRLVVQTTAFDLLRGEVRRKNREAMSGHSQLDVGADSLQLDWLREQIGQLDPELVNIIELRFEQSWSLRKIGEKTGLTIGAVDGRLRRAMKNLKLAAEDPSMPVVVPESSFSGCPGGALAAEAAEECPSAATARLTSMSSIRLTSMSSVESSSSKSVESSSPKSTTQDLTTCAVQVEPLELVGLEDEAGAYDDAL